MLLYSIPQVEQYAPGIKIFDLSPGGYSYEYSMQLLATLGIAGRDTYLYRQLPLDFVYPVFFAISSCLLLAWVFSKGKVQTPAVYYLCLVPILAGLFDYLENIQIILMLVSYPDISERRVVVSSLTTIGKSGLTTAFLVILVIGCFRIAWKKPWKR